jgi:hypothetical protein
MEVYAFASAIILKEYEKAQTQDTQETTEE